MDKLTRGSLLAGAGWGLFAAVAAGSKTANLFDEDKTGDKKAPQELCVCGVPEMNANKLLWMMS